MTTSYEENYEEEIHIDQNDLEGEWLIQASLYLKYSELHANAVCERDTAKVRVEYTHAQLDTEYRKNWEKYFDSKPTEGAIKSKIIQDPKFRKAEKLLISENKKVNLYFGIKLAFDHRKKALENLVSLRISGFHSEPRNIQRDRAIKRKVAKGVQQEQRKALNKEGTRAKTRLSRKRKAQSKEK